MNQKIMDVLMNRLVIALLTVVATAAGLQVPGLVSGESTTPQPTVTLESLDAKITRIEEIVTGEHVREKH